MGNRVQFDDVHEAAMHLNEVRISYWTSHTVFSYSWWFLLISTAGAFLLWIKLVDRKRLLEISLFGSLVLTLIMLLDMIGGELQLWDYPTMVLPWGPRNVCVDIIMTVIYMLIYQYAVRWSTFILALLVMSFLFSFVFEPIAVWLKVYFPFVWQHYYSIPGYLLIGILMKRVLHIFLRFQHSGKAANR
ncbi:CBO0543 family protein [Paenibacillus sp. GD4]|uniref:CBO0543 family protein n=1 Tax=Paenibacillus sp. GD4 TaxID=3068890 RepID=UPI002796601E|nr:CBO0543 family protein [Paenibacillus sp. GD4]MDQ1914405.1 CBO0543 family protein [Paenibacillus sp. GD4]